MPGYRICFVDSIRSWGGAEVWFLETCLALRAAGYQADIVAQPGSELSARARIAGIPCANIPIRFDAAPWTLIKLAHHFRSTGTTAVVANLTKDLKAASVAGRMAGVPTILGTRESDFPLKPKSYYRFYFNKMATGLLVNSEATRKTIMDSVPWLEDKRVHLLYKGIDTVRFSPGPPAEGPPVVGFVGQLIARKGLTALMEAWTQIDRQDRADQPRLRLAGAGPLLADLTSWRAGLRHPDRIEIMGFVEDIAAFYRGLTILAMPSLAEGFGLAAAEASASGLPVVASRTSSLPEIVVHEETGLLIPPRSPDHLAAAVTRLLDDRPLSSVYGRAGRARIEQGFHRNATLRRLLKLTGAPEPTNPKGKNP